MESSCDELVRMRKFDNDNEPDPFSAIGLQAALIVNKLRLQAQLANFAEEHHEGATGQGDASSEKENTSADHREAVAHGVSKIIAFEKRASGVDQRPRRKRS